MRNPGFITGLLLIAILSVPAVPFPHQVDAAQPAGTRFVYYIYWAGIRAGRAVLEYTASPQGTVVRTRATSAAFISLFYKVDDRAQSTLYPDGYPANYTLNIREGTHRRYRITDFAPRVQGKPQKVIFNNVLEGETVEFELEKPAHDPLSAFYAMTGRDIRVGQSIYIDIFDNEKLWNTEVRVLRKERVRVPAGEFSTIVIKPLLKSEGIFLRKGEMHIWLTDDDRRMPVMFTSKAKIGKFRVVLVEADYRAAAGYAFSE